MLVGIGLILLATVAYNSSAVVLALAARSHDGPAGARLLAGVLGRLNGSLGVALTLVGWLLELAALTRISLTLDKIVMTAGFGLLLLLAAWGLHEPIGRRELLGVGAIAVGILAIAMIAPAGRDVQPSVGGWLALSAALGAGMFLPAAAQLGRQRASAGVYALSAGLGYALSGMLTKGVADALPGRHLLALTVLLSGAGAAGLLAFINELAALREGNASAVVPTIAALQTIIPIALAPVFFAETWPAANLLRAGMAAGLACNLIGVLILSRASAGIAAQTSVS